MDWLEDLWDSMLHSGPFGVALALFDSMLAGAEKILPETSRLLPFLLALTIASLCLCILFVIFVPVGVFWLLYWVCVFIKEWFRGEGSGTK